MVSMSHASVNMLHNSNNFQSNSRNKMEHLSNHSSGRLASESIRDGRVLVLYTGGTIGMMRDENGVFVPKTNVFMKKLRDYPHMHDREYADERYGPMGPLVLPMKGIDRVRVVYNILEYSPLCDSSNMTMDDWIRIAKDIKVIIVFTCARYKRY